MMRIWLLVLSVVLLSGCYTAGRITQAVTGMGKDRCERAHPIYAQYISSCYGKYPNLGVTDENANDWLEGVCALRSTVRRGRIDIFKLLVKHGADPKRCGTDYQAGFFYDLVEWGKWWACEEPGFIQQFKAWGLDPGDPQALLFAAAGNQCASVIRYAGELGADPNLTDEKGRLPLDRTVGLTRSDITASRALVEIGADPFKKSTLRGGMPIYDYLFNEHEEEFIKNGMGRNWPLLKNALLSDKNLTCHFGHLEKTYLCK